MCKYKLRLHRQLEQRLEFFTPLASSILHSVLDHTTNLHVYMVHLARPRLLGT